MRGRILFPIAAFAALLAACKPKAPAPRPAVPLVHAIVADTSGLGRLVAHAGHQGNRGSVAIIGDPADAIGLARMFLVADRADNIDGRALRDSLPDFAGESFDVILDAFNAPYIHFLSEGRQAERTDSLRTAAVQNAVFAWDTTCVTSAADQRSLLPKSQAKVVIFTSSLQAEFGLFDVDTLQQLTGASTVLLSPVNTLLDDAFAAGARNLAVWTSRDVRLSHAWEDVFARRQSPEAHLQVITPDPALDVRTEFRNLLRQYRSAGRGLDALIIDSYSVNRAPLLSELAMIRQEGTDEDAALSRMLSPDFRILDPATSAIDATYRLFRERNLFTHRIALPFARYYETVESQDGSPVLMEVAATYAQKAYVPDID